MNEKPDRDDRSSKKLTSSCLYVGGTCFLCVALSILTIILFLSILFAALDVRLGFQSTSFRTLLISVFYAVCVPSISFLAEIIKSLFPWPILLILVLALIAWGPNRIRDLLSSAKFELPGGFKFDGGSAPPDIFRKEMGDAQRAVERANKEIEQAYDGAKIYVSQLRDRYDINKLVGDLALKVADAIGDNCPSDYRLTLYVPDLVFSDRLYQLSEYYDKKGNRVSEGRSGRAFSIRYGVIGRVWRSGVDEIEGELISADDRAQLGSAASGENLDKFIARRWGLTLDEVFKIRPYQSYGAIRLDGGGKSLGVIFFDSKLMNAFGNETLLREKIRSLIRESKLTLSLLEINLELAPWSRIQIFRNL
ncbi:hypothetical protein AB8B02_11855 [Tardiphaga sp. 862_B3_N4_1]|uniref:hypothetical protein n=1 Tax=unclassified Tardiphaga TaxID=2631404 RepID=UPI0008A78CED|nr:hypothetical protein [Tardiphaga sp. OK245]SEH99023.1 hypothetical protein SAMN05216367_2746 [Tardiphaga sp. OK245]